MLHHDHHEFPVKVVFSEAWQLIISHIRINVMCDSLSQSLDNYLHVLCSICIASSPHLQVQSVRCWTFISSCSSYFSWNRDWDLTVSQLRGQILCLCISLHSFLSHRFRHRPDVPFSSARWQFFLSASHLPAGAAFLFSCHAIRHVASQFLSILHHHHDWMLLAHKWYILYQLAAPT